MINRHHALPRLSGRTQTPRFVAARSVNREAQLRPNGDWICQRDGIFREGGDGLILDLNPEINGFGAAFDIGLDLSKPARHPGDEPRNNGGLGRWSDD